MTTFLIAALGATTLLALLLIVAIARSDNSHANARKEWLEERREVATHIQDIERYIQGVVRVLNTNVGGISKRISESAEIAEAIQAHAPDLFKQCDGLAYWLHANDQFLVSLYAAAEDRIEHDHRWRLHVMKEEGRDEVFYQIYDSAGLRPPLIAGTHL